LGGLLAAIGLLTTLPVPGRRSVDLTPGAVRWFAPVGLFLGCLLALVSACAHWAWPAPVAAAVVIAAWAVATGALHLDGLADMADAAFASVSRERRLEILRDVHHGTFGIAAITILLLLKWVALAALPGREAAAAIIVACVSGRAALLPILSRFSSPRPGGMAATMRAGATSLATAAGIAVTLGVGLITGGLAGVGVAAFVTVASLLEAWWLARRFGGISGDACGAIVETGEMLTLLAMSALANHGWMHAFPFGPAA